MTGFSAVILVLIVFGCVPQFDALGVASRAKRHVYIAACRNLANERSCSRWYQQGQCSNPAVGQYCKRACGLCQVTVCQNSAEEESCNQWYEQGQCSNPAVQQYCRKKCGLCRSSERKNPQLTLSLLACQDSAKKSRCIHWYEHGHCSNPAVQQYCRKTCGVC